MEENKLYRVVEDKTTPFTLMIHEGEKEILFVEPYTPPTPLELEQLEEMVIIPALKELFGQTTAGRTVADIFWEERVKPHLSAILVRKNEIIKMWQASSDEYCERAGALAGEISSLPTQLQAAKKEAKAADKDNVHNIKRALEIAKERDNYYTQLQEKEESWKGILARCEEVNVTQMQKEQVLLEKIKQLEAFLEGKEAELIQALKKNHGA